MKANIVLEDIGSNAWEKYAGHIMQLENTYPESMRSTEDDMAYILDSEKKVAKIAFSGNECLGAIIGFHVAPEDYDYYGLSGIPEGAKVIYLMNMVVNPKYRGMGFGRMLLNEFIKDSRKNEFHVIAGHFRQSSSLNAFRKSGGVEKAVFSNWEGSGEDFVLCYLNLFGMTQSLPVPA
ncbi:MAG: GNAT family N-acetyltransferase [Candidatus Aenigmarchaeota archaeon]|nr:GNAT family N-acetyltransferase [Candidatus Aenigmarchaeota archaeon]